MSSSEPKPRKCKSCGVEATSENTSICRRTKPRPSICFNSYCKVCNKNRVSKWQKDNKGKVAAKSARWAEANPDKYAARLEKHRESTRVRVSQYQKDNPEKVAQRVAKRKAMKNEQTPPLTPVEQEWLQFYYDEATCMTEETGIQHEVDHIKPIAKGGLHAPWNLQVLTMEENRSKGAKWLSEAA